MADNIKVVSHVKDVNKELKHKIPIILEGIGIEMAGNAIDEISKLVYDMPEGKSGYARTGRLRNSIAWAIQEKSGTIMDPMESEDSTPHAAPDENVVVIGTNVEYAPYVEAGTSYMPSRPFLKNGVANYAEDYKKLLEEGLKK